MSTRVRPWLVGLLAGLVAASPAAGQVGDPAAASASLCPVPGRRIEIDRFVVIGGIEQWVTLRGDDCANPVILFLHGGPGNPLSPYADALYAGWETDFTLVQWDQRGAGRTFARNPEPTSLTLEGMTGDGVELAAWLAAGFGQDRIILKGGSWGAALGVYMIHARPDLFHAWLGSGQLVSYRDNVAASYRRTLDRAVAGEDAAAVARLEALGPPPWRDPRSFGALRRITRTYEAPVTTPAPAGWWSPSPAYATDAAGAALEAGEEFSYLQFVGLDGDGLFSGIDLPALGTDFPVPVFLVQGAEDLVTTPEVARAWFDSLQASQKEFRLIPGAGHDPNAAMVQAEHDVLVSRILPLVR